MLINRKQESKKGPTGGGRGDKVGSAWGKGAQANKPSTGHANKEPTRADKVG